MPLPLLLHRHLKIRAGSFYRGQDNLVPRNPVLSARRDGRSANSRWSNTDTGILIALYKLTGLSLSAGGGIPSIDPGNRWDAVYEVLARHGVGVLGGGFRALEMGD